MDALLAETTCHVTCRGSTTACHLDGDEVDSGLVGNGLGHKRLSTTRRTVKQHPCCRAQAHGCILLWVSNGLCDGKRQLFPHLQHNLCQYMCQVMIPEMHVMHHKQTGVTSTSVLALHIYESSTPCTHNSIDYIYTCIVQEDKLSLCSSPQLESQHHSR